MSPHIHTRREAATKVAQPVVCRGTGMTHERKRMERQASAAEAGSMSPFSHHETATQAGRIVVYKMPEDRHLPHKNKIVSIHYNVRPY